MGLWIHGAWRKFIYSFRLSWRFFVWHLQEVEKNSHLQLAIASWQRSVLEHDRKTSVSAEPCYILTNFQVLHGWNYLGNSNIIHMSCIVSRLYKQTLWPCKVYFLTEIVDKRQSNVETIVILDSLRVTFGLFTHKWCFGDCSWGIGVVVLSWGCRFESKLCHEGHLA